MIKKDHEGVVLCMIDLRNICNFDIKTLGQIHSLLSDSDSDWLTMQQDIADPGTLAWLELSKKEISSATRSKETTRRPN